MSASRRSIFPSLVLAFLLLTAASSYATTLLPACDNSAILLSQVRQTTSIDVLLGVTSGSETEYEVLVYLLSNGDTTMVIDPETVTFSGPCPGLDNLNLTTFFNYISREAVRDAIANGRIGSTTDCMMRYATTMMVPTCVARIGSGGNTTFRNLSRYMQSTRTFAHCLNGLGAPSVHLGGIAGITPCADGESTCATGGGLN